MTGNGTGDLDSDVPMLQCRECGRVAAAMAPQYCEWCFGPIEVVLPRPRMELADLRTVIGSGPESLARYQPLMPPGLVLRDGGPGWTPLRRAVTLGAALGLDYLWIKDETRNPTGSFKDRVVEVAAGRGVAMGARVLACSSTGNLARAVAGSAARRGLRSVVLVPDDLDQSEIDDLAVRGATVVAVRGGYDAASRLGADAASDLDRWAWVNVTLRPWYEVGARTAGWEIVEQLGWRLPDRVVAPIASGALVRALHESMAHLAEVGLVSGAAPRVTATQPAGCAPVAGAFDSGASQVAPIRHPHTIAESLEMGDPPDGQAVLDAARATGGAVVAAEEDTIMAAVKLLRETEGVVSEPAGGVVVAGLADLVRSGVVDRAETVVVVITGSPPRLASSVSSAEVVPRHGLAGTIDPSVSALTGLLPVELLR